MHGEKIKKKLIEVVDLDHNEKLNLPPLEKIKNKEKSAQIINSPAVKDKKSKVEVVSKLEKMFDLGGMFGQEAGGFKKGHSVLPGHKDKANK